MGKYLSAVCVYLLAISSALLDALIASMYGRVDWPCIISNFLGLLLLGLALIAVCLFLSSMTESQVIAAVLGFAVSLLLVLVDAIAYVVSNTYLQKLFSYISFSDRYEPFTIGVVDLANVLFFMSIAALFVIFSTAVLEKRRWS